jgi:hypothetical protein
MDVYLLVQARVCKIQACDIPQLKRVPAPSDPPAMAAARRRSAALRACQARRLALQLAAGRAPGFCGAAARLKAACR